MSSSDEMPDYVRQGCLNHIHEMQGFGDIRNLVLEPGHVVNEALPGAGVSNLYHKAHGGYLMYLVDITACMAGYACGKHNVTLSANVSFARSLLLDAPIRIEAQLLHNGRSTGLAEVKLYDEQGRVCTTATVTLFFTVPVTPDEPVPRVLLDEMHRCTPAQ
ncbi:MAG: PaaI family thioesterase [Coriobacteriales bacterium]